MTGSFAQQAKKSGKKTMAQRLQPKQVPPPGWFLPAAIVFGAIIAIVIVILAFTGSDPTQEQIESQRQDSLGASHVEYVPAPEDTAAAKSESSGSSDTSTKSSGSTSKKKSAAAEEVSFKTAPTDFKDATQVAVTTASGTENIPAGVRNLAIAGVIAATDGKWSDLPMESQPSRKRPLQGTEPQEDTFLLANPGAAETTNTWVFSVQAVSKSGTYKTLRLIVMNTSSGLKLTPPVVS